MCEPFPDFGLDNEVGNVLLVHHCEQRRAEFIDLLLIGRFFGSELSRIQVGHDLEHAEYREL